MPISLGTTAISGLRVGSASATAAYLGSTQVWSASGGSATQAAGVRYVRVVRAGDNTSGSVQWVSMEWLPAERIPFVDGATLPTNTGVYVVGCGVTGPSTIAVINPHFFAEFIVATDTLWGITTDLGSTTGPIPARIATPFPAQLTGLAASHQSSATYTYAGAALNGDATSFSIGSSFTSGSYRAVKLTWSGASSADGFFVQYRPVISLPESSFVPHWTSTWGLGARTSMPTQAVGWSGPFGPASMDRAGWFVAGLLPNTAYEFRVAQLVGSARSPWATVQFTTAS